MNGFDPHQLAEELTALNQKLTHSLETLNRLNRIDVGQTPCHELYREDKLRLYYYPPDYDSQAPHAPAKPPILIVYALVNRPYILDLQPDRSLIRSLQKQQIPIYLIDWGYPDIGDRYLDLNDYINGYLDRCVEQALSHSRTEKLNLLGVCQGGTLSLCYTAIYPDKIRNLITMVTPVDFHTDDNLLRHLTAQINIDLAVEIYGNIPGQLLNNLYRSLMPMKLGLQKQMELPERLTDADAAMNYLRMEKWIQDCPDQAGEAFREFIKVFFQDNRLLKGPFHIGQHPVDLKKITHPLLNIYGRRDHLVPPSASRALLGLCGTQFYQELELDTGHIGLFVSRKAQQVIPHKLTEWLSER